MAEHNNKDGEFRTFSAGDLSERSVYQLRRLRENHPEGFSTALKILADGSRCEDRREAYGKTGILEYLLELQATMLDIEVRRECLRAIANSCADTGMVIACCLRSSANLFLVRRKQRPCNQLFVFCSHSWTFNRRVYYSCCFSCSV